MGSEILLKGQIPVINQVPTFDKAYKLITETLTSAVLPLLTMLLVGVVVYAGYLLLTAGDNADNVKKAYSALFWGVVGVAVILFSFFLIKAFLFGVLSIKL